MENLPLLYVFIGLGLGAAVTALLAWGLPLLKNQTQGYWKEDEIEALVIPWAERAVALAFKVSERAMDELHVRMDGVDKKRIADMVYDNIPERSGNLPTGVIKKLVTKSQFSGFVQAAYDRMMDSYVAGQTAYEAAYNRWKADMGK